MGGGSIFLHLFFMLEHVLELDESAVAFSIGLGNLCIKQALNIVLCERQEKGC